MIAYRKNKHKQSNTDPAGTICVAGVGGAGCNVLDRMALEGMDSAELVAVNCDVRALQNTMCPRQLQLGTNLTRGLGTGGDPELGRDAAIDSRREIDELFNKREMVFLCVGLGGGTGSGATPQLVMAARDKGAFVVVFAILPFSFEGRRRLQQAHQALEQLRRHADVLIVFENDRMGELALNKEGIQQAFAAADTVISQSIRSIHTLVRQPGLIQIGMDDLMSALRNEDARCLFGYGDAKGENRAQEALKRALKSPLINHGEMLEKSSTILVHVAGGESLTLFEVELLMREMEKQVPDNAHILFGTAIDPKLGELLSVSIISSLSASPRLEEPQPRDESHDEPQDTAEPDHADEEISNESTATIGTGPESAAEQPSPAAEPAAESAAAPDAPESGSETVKTPRASTPDLIGLEIEPAARDREVGTPPPNPPEAEEPAGQPTAQTAAEQASATIGTETPIEPAAVLKPFVSLTPVRAGGQVTANALPGVTSSVVAPAASAATPLGRRLPNFGSPLSQAEPAVARLPRQSLLKSLANGSVPLEKLTPGPLAPLPTRVTPPADLSRQNPPPETMAAAAPEVDAGADLPDANDPDINPIAAAMRSAEGRTARREPDQDEPMDRPLPAPDARHEAVAFEPGQPAEIAPLNQDDQRDFGRLEAERGTIEPFPSPGKTSKRELKHAMANSGSAHQGMLDLDPGSKGRFDRSEPHIVDGEDLDVPAFLRRSR